MGLDITACGKALLVEEISYERMRAIGFEHPLYDVEGHWFLFNHPVFAARGDGMHEGIYKFDGEPHSFRAGSYSGYNQWRDQLAGTGSFVELVHFSDCEGFIGPKTSAKLAADFVAHATLGDGVGWFSQCFRDWRKAFELASGGGVVRFH